jgi:methionine synthase I (cobalamin-dependent)
MKHKIIHKLISILAICGIGFISAYAIAGQDVSQQQMMQSVMQSRQMMQQAEAATGTERQKLMNSHLTMMQEIMGKMQAMKPDAGMTTSEKEAWFNEHQKLMTEMMGQMMQEQHMMMDMGNMPMGVGGGMGGGMGGMNTK